VRRESNPSDDAIEPLVPELAALLAAERRAPSPPAARRARILARLRPIVDAGAGAGAPAAASTAALASKILVAALVAGAVGVGGAIGLARRPPGETAAPPPAPAAAPAPSTTAPERPPAAPTSQVTPPPVEPVRASPRRRPPTPPTTTPATPTATAARAAPDLASLRAEAAILERARGALAAGDPSAALATLAGAERAFPLGFLREEREALSIRALAAAGQRAAARARAAAFAREFPASIQAAAIADALHDDVR
jgi:hypothetical protein